MTPLLVVDNPARVSFPIAGVELVRARDYLTDPAFAQAKGARVFNLCRTSSYQTVGYYVSLLADGRGHRPLPAVSTMQDLKNDALVRAVAAELAPLVEKRLKSLTSDAYTLSIYFGRCLAARHQDLATALFNRFPVPLLRARFHREAGTFSLSTLRAIGLSDVPDHHIAFVQQQAEAHFRRKRGPARRRAARFDLAILVNPEEADAPSDKGALDRFAAAARHHDLDVEFIDKTDAGRIPEFDALFLRETTAVNHHTYRFARRAEADGLVVMDDSTSIVRATNKVFLAEAFAKHKLPHPKSLVVDERHAGRILEEFVFPVVLKRPDSSFSAGVKKAEDPEQLAQLLAAFFEDSELVVAQAWTPSDFDWRVGVLDGQPLYACRYGMAPGHWQIQRVDERGKRHYGAVETMDIASAPEGAVKLAVRAARVVGQGLYGVDIKEKDGRFLVVEVNDNPSIEAGEEDRVLGKDLYRAVMGWFRTRLEARGTR